MGRAGRDGVYGSAQFPGVGLGVHGDWEWSLVIFSVLISAPEDPLERLVRYRPSV